MDMFRRSFNTVGALVLLVITFTGHYSLAQHCPISCPQCPCFTNGPYNFEIAENTSIGASIATLVATGMDVTYSSESDLFIMDPVTAELTLGGTLDYETQSTYQFRVEGSVNDMYVGRADVTIQVLNVNDFAPQCSPSVVYFSVPENQAGVSFTLPNCIDGDSPDNPTFSYELTAFSNLFTIDTNGVFTITQSLDFESQDLYDITIAVNDTDIPPGPLNTTIRAIVAVEPVNEFAPVFTQNQYIFNVSESTVIGSVVGQVNAADDDGGEDGQVIYSLSSGRTDLFTVNEMTGDIILTQTLDFEDTVSHLLTVTATDSSTIESSRRTSTASIVINVFDSNDQPPTFAQPVYSLEVRENTDPGTLLIQLPCEDLDTGVNKELMYTILSGNSEGRYSIEPTSGNVTLDTNLNYDDPTNTEFFSLSVQCQEVASPHQAAKTLLLIKVVSFNSFAPQPTDIEFVVSIPEDTPPGTALVTVEATDRDRGPGGVLRYYINFGILMPECRGDIISIDESSGVVYLISPLNYENGIHEIYCIVAIWDSGHPIRPNEVDLYISVENVNDEAPRCYPHVNVMYVAEDTTVDTTIYRLPCNDSDSSNLQYMLVSSQTQFRIESGGDLVIDSALDFETEAFHLLQVQVSDGAFTANATVQIIVENVNEHAPLFTQQIYHCSLNEDTVIGTTLPCAISASDQDGSTAGEVQYRLTTSSPFSLTPEGELILSTALTFEHQSVYLVEIEAYDLGTPSLSSTGSLNITIIVSNDNHPRLLPFIFESIPENAASGAVVTNVVCTDVDTGSNGEVHLEALEQFQGNLNVTHLQPFQIDPVSGEVTVNSDLDFETAREYRLTVQCTDHGSPSLSSTALLFISVLPVNEYPPAITNPPSPSDLLIPERAAIGRILYTISAIDQDHGEDGIVTFDLSSISHEPAPFDINLNSGEILLTASLNCEQNTQYVLSLKVQDNGQPSLFEQVNVTANVTDCHLGDVVPEHFVYSMNITENSPIGDLVGSVACSSTRDIVHSSIEPMYRLVFESDHFGVGLSSGDINVLISPDYENRAAHKLTIECYDPNHPDRASKFSVFINILPQNEFVPEFQDSNLRVDVSEGTALGAMILTIQANDLDRGQDGVVLYSIDESQLSPVVIDEQTGEVYLAISLDRESVDTLTITVSAQDASVNVAMRRSATTMLTLSVTDVNDNWPQCAQVAHHLIVSPHTTVPQVLVDSFLCIDIDIYENSVLQYEFSEDRVPSELFDISTGSLLLIGSLSATGPLQYYLPITVKDGGMPSLTASLLVIIDVQEPEVDVTEEELLSLVEVEGLRNSVWIVLHDLPHDLWESTGAEETFQVEVARTVTHFCALLPEACSLVSGCSGFFGVQRKRSVPDSYAMFTEPSVVVVSDRQSAPTSDNTLSIQFYVALPTEANRSPNRETNYVVPGATLSLIVEENERTIEAVVRDSVVRQTTGTTYPGWIVAVAVVCGMLGGGILAAVIIACCVKYIQRHKKKQVAPVVSIDLRQLTQDPSTTVTSNSLSKRESVTSELSGVSNDAACNAPNTQWTISRLANVLKVKRNSEVISRTSRSTSKRESQSSLSGSSSATSNKAVCDQNATKVSDMLLLDFDEDDISTISLNEDSERTSLENVPSQDRQGHIPHTLLRELNKELDTPPQHSLPHTPNRPALRLSVPRWK